MGRIFSTGAIPKDIPTWQYNAFRQIAAALKDGTDGLAAISRNETPDGSGSPLVPPTDLTAYFKLIGRSPGQVAYGATTAAGTLTLGSSSNATKGFIYLGLAQPRAAFDETQGFLGLGTDTPTALLNIVGSTLAELDIPGFTVSCGTTNSSATVTAAAGSFTPTGGPRVVPGMLVTGTGIPTGTYVEHVTNSVTLTLTRGATTTATNTLTFTSQVVIQVSQETETGRDIEWTTHGGLRITPGTGGTPLRITGDKVAPASGASAAARVYIEGGKISGGAALGAQLQIGGPGHGELQVCDFLSRTFYFNRSPNSGPTTVVAVNQNPQEFGSSGPSNAVGLLISTLPVMLIDGATLEMRGQTTGTSPSKVVGEKGWDVDLVYNIGWYTGNHDAEVRNFYIGQDSQNSGRGARFGFRIVNQSEHPSGGSFANKNILSVIPDRVWATADIAPVYTTRLDFGDDKRGMLTGRANAAMTRFGIVSAFTTISDGTPDTIPLGTALLHLDLNSTTAQVGFLISAPGGAQTGDMMQVVSANAGGVTFIVDSNSMLQATIKSNSILADSADVSKKMTLDLSAITTSTTRANTVPNVPGLLVLVGTGANPPASGAINKLNLTGQTADITATNLTNSTPAGMYEVSYVLEDTTADLTAGIATLTITWTDDVGSTTVTATQALTGTGRSSGSVVLYLASGNITYAITHTGIFATSAYALRIRTKFLG